MKIFFDQYSSLYKVFNTLEKLPKGKQIEIYFDPQHPIFQDKWRISQLKDIIQKRRIKAIFFVNGEKEKKFLEDYGLEVIKQDKNSLKKILQAMYLFFFNIGKFHLYIYSKKNIVFYLVFGLEITFLLAILYFFYSLLIPHAKIYIKPSYNIQPIVYNFRFFPQNDIKFQNENKFISIPYKTGVITYKYSLNIGLNTLKQLNQPIYGKVKIYNKTPYQYSIVKNSKFITKQGRLAENKVQFKLPPAGSKTMGETILTLYLLPNTVDGDFIKDPKIPKGTVFYIKNLKTSYYFHQIFAVAIEDFTGKIKKFHITNQDLNFLTGKLLNYLQKNKIKIIKENFNLPNTLIFPINELVSIKNIKFNIPFKSGDVNENINGEIIADLEFKYINLNDLLNGFLVYLKQRPLEKENLIKLDKNSISFFFDGLKFDEKNHNIFSIPTKINVIQGYNFDTDINNLQTQIKDQIISKSEEEAKKIILTLPEVASVKIKIFPFWYNLLPRLKSNLKIIVEE